MNYIIAIGTFQALVASVLLWRNKLRSKEDRLLILLLACIAAHLAIKFYIYTTVTDAQVRLQMNTFIGVCYGPLLYLYALKKKDSAFIPIRKWYLFLPFLLSAIGYLTVTSVLTVSREAGYAILAIYNNTTTYLFLTVNALLPLLAIYAAKQLPAEKEKEKQLIREVGFWLLGLSLAGIVNKTIIASGNVQFNLLFRSVAYAILAIICIIIVRFKYVGVVNAVQEGPAPSLQDDIAEITMQQIVAEEDPATIGDTEIPPRDAPPALTRKLQLNGEEHGRIWHKMEQLMEMKQLFTDAELNLDKLAGALDINKYHLSETLNNYAGKSFYQYINEHRIQYIVGKMQLYTEKGVSVNVLSLAYEAGFKAKSSFNQHFKKLTGHTPTEYMKMLSEHKAAVMIH